MKKRNYLIFTSWIGVMLLYLVTIFEVLQKNKYRLLLKLLGKFFIYSVFYLFIPLTVFGKIIEIYDINLIISQNILDFSLFLWNYFIGVIAMKDLLKWKQESVKDDFDLVNRLK